MKNSIKKVYIYEGPIKLLYAKDFTLEKNGKVSYGTEEEVLRKSLFARIHLKFQNIYNGQVYANKEEAEDYLNAVCSNSETDIAESIRLGESDDHTLETVINNSSCSFINPREDFDRYVVSEQVFKMLKKSRDYRIKHNFIKKK